MVNAYGLDRRIPADVKLAVRQRDGFGCVVCGKAIFEYEHFDPEFKDARVHDANGIILLCPEHHSLKTRGLLSRETIARAKQNPAARHTGFSYGVFDVVGCHITLQLGNIQFEDTPIVLQVEGDELLSLRPPEETGGPLRVNALLLGGSGEKVLEIVDNEWRTPVENWDIDITGSTFRIRSSQRKIEFILHVESNGRFAFRRFNLFHRGIKIELDARHRLTFTTPDGRVSSVQSGSLRNFDIGILFEDGGLVMGVGPGQLELRDIRIGPAP